MNYVILTMCVSVLLLGCSQEKKTIQSPYFSVPEFISRQATSLHASHTALSRTVAFKDSTETITIATPDWSKELKPFTECDLNLPAWRNGFDIDSTRTNGTLTVRYRAREKRITVRELELSMIADSISSLSIVYLKSNTWYSLGRKLTYHSGKGYTIVIEQDTPLQDPETIRLEGRFQ